MKFDSFTFNRPSFYKKKAEIVYRLKKTAYALLDKDLDGDWKTFLGERSSLLKGYCRDRTVLDVGCGTGDFLNELKHRYGARTLFGLDISPAMISEAKNANPHYNYVIGSSDRLPFEDNSFDVVTFQWVYHHLSPSTASAAMNEAKRVSRETIVVQDTVGYDSGPMRYLSLLYWALVDGGSCYRTRAQWRELFEDNGLKVIEERFGSIIRTGIFVLGKAKSRTKRKRANGAQ
ncbi:MAG: class I SAM-dependent methyltransferase [Actinobacteria bacterium]|nr:class I SAM-dependent methyltransferase [Actinomycetota bacterium]